MQKMIRCFSVCCLASFCLSHALAGENLLINGSFDDKEDPLKGWLWDYRFTDNTWYAKNHEHVSVLPAEGVRKGVLKLNVGDRWLADNGGVKVDSKPVPFEPDARYRLSFNARTTGPKSRIYIEGYQWKPGIKPHPDPEFHELRMIYKGKIVFMGNTKEGTFTGTTKSWEKGTTEFPMEDRSDLSQKHLKSVKFISVHIVGIVVEGDLFVDDVVLERIK